MEVTFCGSGDRLRLLVWVRALGFLCFIGFEGFGYENKKHGLYIVRDKIVLVRIIKVVNNIKSYHDTL